MTTPRIEIIDDADARRQLIDWIGNTQGCDNSCLAQLYSIITTDTVRVRSPDGTLGSSAWDGGDCAEVFEDE
jgi:hypothetical protein